MVNVPPSTFDELDELLGEEDEVTQAPDENTTIVVKRIDNGYQQIITFKEWVSDTAGKRTTTMVRNYFAAVEDEEVEEEVEEVEIDEETYQEMLAKAPPPPVEEVGKDGKKKKKKQKMEGKIDVIQEAFPGGYREITTVYFPDGTSKKTTKMFYDPTPAPKSETQVVEESQTTKSGKKKKVKKVVNLNEEVLETYKDDDDNTVVITRERFPDGSGHKDVTTTKMPNGEVRRNIQNVFYPKEKEIVETTEIHIHEASSVRMNVKETISKQNHGVEETEERSTTSTKKTKKTKSSKIEKQSTLDNDEDSYQHVQHAEQEDGVETKKIIKRQTKKVTSDDQREALMARDNAEGVTTVVREKTDKGYREISTTVFSDGSTKTQTREFFDAVEETVDPQQALAMRENLAVLANQPPQVQSNADGSTSTIIVERISNGYRQTTSTKKLNGSTSVQIREFYDPVEEDFNDSGSHTRRVVQSKQQIQGNQTNMMKSVKMFG